MNKSMRQLTQFAACAVAALSVVACSSEDTAQQDNAKQNITKGVATFDGSQPGNDTRALTRTTATYTLGGDAKVFWTSADKIFVQDDANSFHQSDAANLYNPSNKAKATFSLASGSFTLNNREVRYTGENGTDANTVTIASTQTQTTANDFSHLGTSGDCGTATATGSNGNYTFTLNHKASYLCFVPRCMNTDLGPNIKLTKIKVTADQPIAGKYDFSTGSLAQKTGETYSNTITLNTSDFSLNTTVSSLATNGAYMVVAPGTYNFTITYTIKDPTTNVEGDIVKTVSSYNCQEGKINDITANLTPMDYPGHHYYMWDAQQNYWHGHEWNAATHEQPTVLHGYNTNYPQNATVDPARWYNPTFSGSGVATSATQPFFSTLPNINEAIWYLMEGDPHWEADALWSLMGHLYHGGMWFKKKNNIPGFNKLQYGGTDYRTTYYGFWKVSTKSRPTNTNDYFFLPAMGYYWQGHLNELGTAGDYWTSSAHPTVSEFAYDLYFNKDGVEIMNPNERYYGFYAAYNLFE